MPRMIKSHEYEQLVERGSAARGVGRDDAAPQPSAPSDALRLEPDEEAPLLEPKQLGVQFERQRTPEQGARSRGEEPTSPPTPSTLQLEPEPQPQPQPASGDDEDKEPTPWTQMRR